MSEKTEKTTDEQPNAAPQGGPSRWGVARWGEVLQWENPATLPSEQRDGNESQVTH